jgi:uncharacterized protein (DUF1697 family)
MQRFCALLGGINVGGHRVKMDQLRALFESMGLFTVETLLASGNVIFETEGNDSEQIERQIEQHLRKSLGYPVPTFLRSAGDLVEIAAYQPFPSIQYSPEERTLIVLFLKCSLTEEQKEVMDIFQTETDLFHANRSELYWLTGKRMSDSPVDWKLFNKTIAMPAGTMRNANTIRKLAEVCKL